MANVLVTGGAGYIGSHTVLELLEKGYSVTVVDNLSNSSKESLRRVEKLTGKKVDSHFFDVRDEIKLSKLFADNNFDAVIHFAGLKAVGESVAKPLDYYENNIVSTLTLCRVMEKYKVNKLVFSSSATVYGAPDKVPISENSEIRPTNPYGQTKAMIEQMFKDLVGSETGWQVTLLRYFNPIGAHESGQIGEDPLGVPNNLLPFVAQVAAGRRKGLKVFGNDYDTPDGTGVRDYIHVVDLARGHVAALKHKQPKDTCEVYNLGTGIGYSVLEVISAFEQACGKSIPYKIVNRRPGDIAMCYADTSKAELELGWRAEKSLEQACVDAWRWQSKNPGGYKDS